MSLKTPAEYVQSLKDLKIRAYVDGERIESVADHPAIAPHINTVAKTYQLAHQPEHADVMTTTSHLTGEQVHRYTHIFQSADDLVKKIQMLRLLGQTTGTCFQRCVGLDALNALYAATYDIDAGEGTSYHERFRSYLTRVQRDDLMLAGAMTDPKGHRALRPSQQEDPDQFVRVVERRDDGVVIRGAKLHNTGGINSHEILVMPGTGLKEEERDYAIACAVPAGADGVVFIFGRQSNDSRKLEGGCDIGNPRFGVVGGEAMVVFDDVFVPHDQIFLNGETSYCGSLVNYFATWHRANYGGCKGGNADVLIGATAKMTKVLGTEKNAVVRDKLVEMIHMNETTYASAIGASAMGYPLPCGAYMVDPMMANTVKQNITRNTYQIGRLSHDLAGGFLATMPGGRSFENPEIAEDGEKYSRANPEYEAKDRIKLGRYIENMTSVTTLVEAMHGAGSPQAQRIVMLGQADIEKKIYMAEQVIDGDDDVEGLPLPGKSAAE
ncbi:MAG: 4-hydroxyphenylacetate 3-hydroxylase N-terminal domain-containing protein [Acidobacteriota bacterium]|nr:4-hydroxyphenylacetate 3-hydroxylase N-terminal domain-containing protein [Acidobacteriota bacterium]